jgi:hypothetical protein
MSESEPTFAERIARIRALAERLDSPEQRKLLNELLSEVLELSDAIQGRLESLPHRPVHNID